MYLHSCNGKSPEGVKLITKTLAGVTIEDNLNKEVQDQYPDLVAHHLEIDLEIGNRKEKTIQHAAVECLHVDRCEKGHHRIESPLNQDLTVVLKDQGQDEKCHLPRDREVGLGMIERGTEENNLRSRLPRENNEQDREIDQVLEMTVGSLEKEGHGSQDVAKDQSSKMCSERMKSGT